jgi:lipopolysaccharide/colanic/teichoic acid biosynthesis glycosyltransferase
VAVLVTGGLGVIGSPLAGRAPVARTSASTTSFASTFNYLENWSTWLDITILLKTIPAVLAGRTAY